MNRLSSGGWPKILHRLHSSGCGLWWSGVVKQRKHHADFDALQEGSIVQPKSESNHGQCRDSYRAFVSLSTRHRPGFPALDVQRGLCYMYSKRALNEALKLVFNTRHVLTQRLAIVPIVWSRRSVGASKGELHRRRQCGQHLKHTVLGLKTAVEGMGKQDTSVSHVIATQAAPKILDSSLDFVYIDPWHDYCGCAAEDMEAHYAKLRPGGMLAGHDVMYDSFRGEKSNPGSTF